MKIPLARHLEYCRTTFTEDEVKKIHEYLFKSFDEFFAKEELSDENVWYYLVKTFLKISEGKKTKAWFYQAIVLNHIVDDNWNGKKYCKRKDCPIIERMRARIGRPLDDKEIQNLICINLGLCLFFPEHPLETTKYGPGITYFMLDDSIVSKKESKR